jgi:integrase
MAVRRRKVRRTLADGSVEVKSFWWVHIVHRFADGSKKEIRRHAPQNTRASAVRFERRLRNSIEDGSFESVDPSHTVKTVGEELLRSLRLTKKPSSVAWYEGHLNTHVLPALGPRSVHTITTAAIEKFAEGLKEGRQPSTVNGVLRVLRRLLRFAARRGYLKTLPEFPRLSEAPRKDVQLSPEQLDRLLAAAEPGWRVLFTLAAHTGLRIGELAALKWEAVDLRNRQLFVRLAVHDGIEGLPKSNQVRVVPLNGPALAALEGHKRIDGVDYVFTLDGKQLDRRDVRFPLERAVKAAKVPRVTIHGLRHVFGSHLVERGAGLSEVRDLMGHSSLTVTERYLHSRPSRLAEAVARLERAPQEKPEEPEG